MTALRPREAVPALDVPTVTGEHWSLAAQAPANFTLVVVYRGLHCPICGPYVKDLDDRVASFRERGVEPIALSSDTRERAVAAREKWRLSAVTLGYGLPLDTARAWGLYISAGIGKTSAGLEEPAQFAEPGLFLVRPDGTLYYGSVQTMPFARPAFADILQAVDFVLARDYPARGELAA